jgi:hypothetical protein
LLLDRHRTIAFNQIYEKQTQCRTPEIQWTNLIEGNVHVSVRQQDEDAFVRGYSNNTFVIAELIDSLFFHSLGLTIHFNVTIIMVVSTDVLYVLSLSSYCVVCSVFFATIFHYVEYWVHWPLWFC